MLSLRTRKMCACVATPYFEDMHVLEDSVFGSSGGHGTRKRYVFDAVSHKLK